MGFEDLHFMVLFPARSVGAFNCVQLMEARIQLNSRYCLNKNLLKSLIPPPGRILAHFHD